MSVLRTVKKTLTTLIRVLTLPLGSGGRRRLLRLFRDGMATSGYDVVIKEIPTGSAHIRFYCLGNLPLWRAETLLTKEPETIAWIDEFTDDDVLYDIGANIGVYSLYAGATRRSTVLAFEPLASNYYLLNRNIEENNLSDRVSAFCLAFTDTGELGRFYAQDTAFGSALSSFGEPIEQYGQSHASDFEQGMIGFTLDNFIETFAPPFPTRIKIDVDGIEDKIIAGAQKTLADSRVKSVSVELDSTNSRYTNSVIANLEAAGLSLTARQRSEIFDGTPVEHMYNYRFDRMPCGSEDERCAVTN